MTLDLSPENLAFLVKVGQLPTEAVEVEVTPTEVPASEPTKAEAK
ncbi:MAG: hypothetical protein WCK79_08035 [Actinomycetes bacterium]|jgi:hypothetical protein